MKYSQFSADVEIPAIYYDNWSKADTLIQNLTQIKKIDAMI